MSEELTGRFRSHMTLHADPCSLKIEILMVGRQNSNGSRYLRQTRKLQKSCRHSDGIATRFPLKSILRRKLNTISIQQKSIHSTTNEVSVFKGGLFFSGTGLGTGSGTGQELELEEGRHHFNGGCRRQLRFWCRLRC